MTATPMELELEQWLDLLRRADAGLDRTEGERVVNALLASARRATAAPDEEPRLRALCKASRDFTRALEPFVTRRRRDDDDMIRRFAARVGPGDGRVHVHRNVEKLPIDWAAGDARFDARWFDVLFAAECMSQSARGLPFALTREWPHEVRDAYTKLAQGHVRADTFAPGTRLPLPDGDAVDARTRGKVERTAYWFAELEAARTRVVEHARGVLDPDSEHPRIVAAVKAIEEWTEQGEKVLVFGVFLHPLERLRKVLNARHVLRMVDARRPLAYAPHGDPDHDAILKRQLERLRGEGRLRGALAEGGLAALRSGLAESRRLYRNLRGAVETTTARAVEQWIADPAVLGRLETAGALRKPVERQLEAFVLDRFLAEGSEARLEATERREEIEALAEAFLDERLAPVLACDGGDLTDDEEARRRCADNVRAAMEDASSRQSEHARLLQGSTDWSARVNLQAAFNRPMGSPAVLIAQSQVGREGLNLHQACRVVVQFHAEWSPATLEQQIGRVDRKGSLWEHKAEAWMAGGAVGAPPRIEVRQLVFEGTYDELKWDRVRRRQASFDASLFGKLLSADAWARVPPSWRDELLAAAPSFRPGPVQRALSETARLASVGDSVENREGCQPGGEST